MDRKCAVIFVSVGSQLPFDRLIHMMEEIAPRLSLSVFAQVGNTKLSPTQMSWQRFLSPEAFTAKSRACTVMVTHAGIGSILSAGQFGKPIIVIPRDPGLGEHRNDHQISTARNFAGRPGIYCATDKDQIERLLSQDLSPVVTADNANRGRLITGLRQRIRDGR